MLSFKRIWDNHPYPVTPCDAQFVNQCAIRLGVALRAAGCDFNSFKGALCYPGFSHNPKHILRAEELANWMLTRVADFGTVTKKKNASSDNWRDKQGIVFIKDGWPGGGDHIDAWDGKTLKLKGGDTEWLKRGENWFWELAP